jgi:hypothetical protein
VEPLENDADCGKWCIQWGLSGADLSQLSSIDYQLRVEAAGAEGTKVATGQLTAAGTKSSKTSTARTYQALVDGELLANGGHYRLELVGKSGRGGEDRSEIVWTDSCTLAVILMPPVCVGLKKLAVECKEVNCDDESRSLESTASFVLDGNAAHVDKLEFALFEAAPPHGSSEARLVPLINWAPLPVDSIESGSFTFGHTKARPAEASGGGADLGGPTVAAAVDAESRPLLLHVRACRNDLTLAQSVAHVRVPSHSVARIVDVKKAPEVRLESLRVFPDTVQDSGKGKVSWRVSWSGQGKD